MLLLTRTIYLVSENISYLGPKRGDIIPQKLKEASSMDSFKKLVNQKMNTGKLPMQAVLSYISGVEFL